MENIHLKSVNFLLKERSAVVQGLCQPLQQNLKDRPPSLRFVIEPRNLRTACSPKGPFEHSIDNDMQRVLLS